MRKIFSVYIHNKEYDVFDIEGKEHQGYNDTPKTWWIHFSTKLPDGLMPNPDSKDLKPFCVGIKRRIWEIKIIQVNNHKIKWDEDRFSNHIQVYMICNKKQVYGFGTFDMAFALAKLQYLQVIMSEHPYDFFNPENENGRKIYWKGLPATVKVKMNTWEIGIVPDYTTGISKKQWWVELEKREKIIGGNIDKEDALMDKEDFDESLRDDYINWGDALSDQHINWFRKI